MKIRINLTEVKAPVNNKKVAADKKVATQQDKLKEALYPMITKLVKENNGFANSLEDNEDPKSKSLKNTSDEDRLDKAFAKASPQVTTALNNIQNPNELDGALETLFNLLGVKNMPMGNFLASAKTALMKITGGKGVVGADKN